MSAGPLADVLIPQLESQASNDQPLPVAQGTGNLRLLLDGRLRTEQLRYLNLQRARGLQAIRERVREAREHGEYLDMPYVRFPSIRVGELRNMFREPTHCKWCGDELTAETLALTFDELIQHGGDPNIENVVAICKYCFFFKGIYPQWFWEGLVTWLAEDRNRLGHLPRLYALLGSQGSLRQVSGPTSATLNNTHDNCTQML